MKRGMSLEHLLTVVVVQRDSKRDFVVNTKESIRMIEDPDLPLKVGLELLMEEASELGPFEITENCHRQIAEELGIPWKHYDKLLSDHRDLLINQVNALFKREPKTRLLRTLDGKARAFLPVSDRAIDNDEVIEEVLPPIVRGDGKPSKLLSSNISENNMYIKVLFTDDSLEQVVGTTRDGAPDTVRPGFIVKNSEINCRSLDIDGFFWRSCCDNGCVFKYRNVFSLASPHIWSNLAVVAGDHSALSDDFKQQQKELIIAEVTAAVSAITNADNVRRMGDALRATKNGTKVEDAFAAVNQLAKELPIMEAEKKAVISNLLTDGDFSRWGMLNAVTKVANSDHVDYERACELEDIGAQIIDMEVRQWDRIALAKTE